MDPLKLVEPPAALADPLPQPEPIPVLEVASLEVVELVDVSLVPVELSLESSEVSTPVVESSLYSSTLDPVSGLTLLVLSVVVGVDAAVAATSPANSAVTIPMALAMLAMSEASRAFFAGWRRTRRA